MFGKKKDGDPADQKAAVLKALSAVVDPSTRKDIVTAGSVKNLTISGTEVAFTIETAAQAAVADRMRSEAAKAVDALGWPSYVHIDVAAAPKPAQPPQLALAAGSAIKNIVAIASGKGGVGKSTVATNLAFALKRSGARVGLLDADIYGPSVPHMLGIAGKRPTSEVVNGRPSLAPIDHEGIKVMSMGFLVDVEKAVIWRGPMVTQAVQQFWGQTQWGELDYLIIDLPPGTGDIQLTMVQNIPLSGAVVVTTPQDVAMIDARKALNMFRDTNVAILGIVENMSNFQCPHCGESSPIFGHDGARAWAERSGTKFLGAIPLHMSIRAHGDDGTPAVAAKDTDAAVIQAFTAVAKEVVAQLDARRGQGPSKKLELFN